MSSPPPPPPPTTVTTTQPPPPPEAAAAPTIAVLAPPPRKFPAPCWTQDETLALISAYQDKWYSLRRRNLRTADWESVAADVTRRCPDQSPPKTSAQCRHKMEKLRKRYRTEKQRALSLPNNLQARFFSPSSWVFFDLMEAMEQGSSSTTTPTNNNNNNPKDSPQNPQNGSCLKVVNDPIKLDLADRPSNSKYFDEILMGGVGGASGGPIKFKVKNHHPQHHHHHQTQNQNLHRFENSIHEDEQDDYYDLRNQMAGGGSSKRKYPGQDYDDRFDPRKILNGGPKSGSGSGSSRTRDSVAEMVSSIRMLGEGLVRMEKMKMDMMREIEKMRMEMEMKRSEMILESQQLIVNAFVEGFKSKKKIKVMEVE